MRMFDIERAMAESGLQQSVLDGIVQAAREDYPEDEMLFELRVIRSISAAVHYGWDEAGWNEAREQDLLWQKQALEFESKLPPRKPPDLLS